MSAKTPIRRLDVRLMAALLGGLLSAACLAEPPATPVPERIVADLATRAGLHPDELNSPLGSFSVPALVGAAEKGPEGAVRMPNFAGLTLSEVLNRSAEVHCDLVLSGGNIDPRILASIMVRELAREERIGSTVKKGRSYADIRDVARRQLPMLQDAPGEETELLPCACGD